MDVTRYIKNLYFTALLINVVRIMPTLRSGLVIAGGYANKVRATVFAQLKEDIKQGRIDNKSVAFHVAQLNRFLYTLFVERLKIDKGDVVRITINYEVTDGKIVWDFKSLKVEVFRRVPEAEVEKVLNEIVPEAEKIMKAPVEYFVEPLGSTADGDLIYSVKVGNVESGVIEVLQINEELAYVKTGAILDPEPVIIEKVKLPLEGLKLEELLKRKMSEMVGKARYVSREEAEAAIQYIKKRLQEMKPTEAVVKLEE